MVSLGKSEADEHVKKIVSYTELKTPTVSPKTKKPKKGRRTLVDRQSDVKGKKYEAPTKDITKMEKPKQKPKNILEVPAIGKGVTKPKRFKFSSTGMPYVPINSWLSPMEDIRLQHRHSKVASELTRSTKFNKREIQWLLQLYHIFTTKRNRTMDIWSFTEFMGIYLDFTNSKATSILYSYFCADDERMTDCEFVKALSEILLGYFNDRIKLCFHIYVHLISKKNQKIYTSDLTSWLRKRSSRAYGEGYDHSDDDTPIFVIEMFDKDKDDIVSFEDFRLAVAENLSRLQLLDQVLPEPRSVDAFLRLFSKKWPYGYGINSAYMNLALQEYKNIGGWSYNICDLDTKSLHERSSVSTKSSIRSNNTDSMDGSHADQPDENADANAVKDKEYLHLNDKHDVSKFRPFGEVRDDSDSDDDAY